MGHAFRKDYMEKMKRRYVKAQTRAQKDALIDETVAMCGLVRRGPSKEDQPPSCGGLAAEPKWISGRGKMDQGLRRGGSAAERGNEWDGLGEGRVKVLGVLGAPPPDTPGRVQGTLHPRARPADAPPSTPQGKDRELGGERAPPRPPKQEDRRPRQGGSAAIARRLSG